MTGEWKVAYVISRYTNENSNYKRHIIGSDGKPICNSHTRSFSLEYTDEQTNCLRCLKREQGVFAIKGEIKITGEQMREIENAALERQRTLEEEYPTKVRQCSFAVYEYICDKLVCGDCTIQREAIAKENENMADNI